MNILFAANNKYAGPTSVMLHSLCKSNKGEEMEFYLAYSGLSDEVIDRFSKIIGAHGYRLNLIDVGESIPELENGNETYSREIYYRIIALERLPQSMDRVLYLDGDMLIKGKLFELYNTNMEKDCPFVACEDIHAYMRGSDGWTRGRTFISSGCKYFNSGLILFNLHYFRERRSVGYIMDAFIREGEKFPCPDQDILNIMYADKVKIVPWSKYNLPPMRWKIDISGLSNGKLRYISYIEEQAFAKSDYVDVTEGLRDQATIIHFLGILKPWNYRNGTGYTDLSKYINLWLDAESDMYEFVKGIERIE